MSEGDLHGRDGGGPAKDPSPFLPWPAGVTRVAGRRHADGGGAPISDPEEDEGYGDDEDEDDDDLDEEDDEEPWQVRE